ncbi:MAG: AraC family transcriptional regulator, partial [Polyangiaceae bacterium]
LGSSPTKKAKTLDPRVKTALVRMDRDPAAPIGIDEIASGLKMSRFELTRLFRRDIGKCPYPYVVASRLAHAVHLLETGTCSLVQAALASGFTDYDAFASLYVRAHGQSGRNIGHIFSRRS